jgi:hypothetical protein
MKGQGVVRRSSLPGRENLRKQKPRGVTRTKQGGKGYRRNKASRGRESLKAQHSRVRQTRCRSLPVSSSVAGHGTPWKAVRDDVHRLRSRVTRGQPARVDLCTTGQGQERMVPVIRHWRRSGGQTPRSPGPSGPSSRWERPTNTALGRRFAKLCRPTQVEERRSRRW